MMYCLCCLCPFHSRCLYLWHFRVRAHLFQMAKTNNRANHSGNSSNNKNDDDDDHHDDENTKSEERKMKEQKTERVRKKRDEKKIKQFHRIFNYSNANEGKGKIKQKEICEIQMHSTWNTYFSLYFLLFFVRFCFHSHFGECE